MEEKSVSLLKVFENVMENVEKDRGISPDSLAR